MSHTVEGPTGPSTPSWASRLGEGISNVVHGRKFSTTPPKGDEKITAAAGALTGSPQVELEWKEHVYAEQVCQKLLDGLTADCFKGIANRNSPLVITVGKNSYAVWKNQYGGISIAIQKDERKEGKLVVSFSADGKTVYKPGQTTPLPAAGGLGQKYLSVLKEALRIVEEMKKGPEKADLPPGNLRGWVAPPQAAQNPALPRPARKSLVLPIVVIVVRYQKKNPRLPPKGLAGQTRLSKN